MRLIVRPVPKTWPQIAALHFKLEVSGLTVAAPASGLAIPSFAYQVGCWASSLSGIHPAPSGGSSALVTVAVAVADPCLLVCASAEAPGRTPRTVSKQTTEVIATRLTRIPPCTGCAQRTPSADPGQCDQPPASPRTPTRPTPNARRKIAPASSTASTTMTVQVAPSAHAAEGAHWRV